MMSAGKKFSVFGLLEIIKDVFFVVVEVLEIVSDAIEALNDGRDVSK